MSETTITGVTDAARPVPVAEKIRSGRDLAEALAAVRLSDDEARAWRADRSDGRNAMKLPADKWR